MSLHVPGYKHLQDVKAARDEIQAPKSRADAMTATLAERLCKRHDLYRPLGCERCVLCDLEADDAAEKGNP